MTLLEVCIDNTDGLNTCVRANVDRIELCSALSVGGLTPSAGFIKLAAERPIDVHVLIRPRSGDFYFNEHELDLMCSDVASAVDAGVNGVVIGAANQDGTLNIDALRRLSKAAGRAHLTLHRVIDTMDNPLDAMEQVIDLGFSTILSSGGNPRAQDGIRMLTELNNQANDRIQIMAGAGLTPSAIIPINQQTGITAFHSSCSQTQNTECKLTRLGFSGADTCTTNAELIKQYQSALKAIGNS